MAADMTIPVKKQVESSEIQTGFCKYCGQGFQLETSGECSQGQLDEWASEKCGCDEAKETRKRQKQEDEAAANIAKLFDGRDIYGVKPVLMAAVRPVAEGIIDSVAVNVGNGVKGTVRMTPKGKIQVKKTTTIEDTKEN